MIQIRNAAYADVARIKELWSICFGDSEAFMSWFFTERYFPQFSSVLEEDGVIMSALQSYPLHVRVRGTILPASMLAGVSTHPERNGRGYMKRIFLHYMQQVRERGIPIVVHKPSSLLMYASRGHLPATDVQELTIAAAQGGGMPQEIAPQLLTEDLALLQVCYQKATAGYSGCVSRSMADFAYKCRDYHADGARCFVYRKEGEVEGYCIYYEMEGEIKAEELFGLSDDACYKLIDALAHTANGRKLSIKLPPDKTLTLPGAEREIHPMGVMGIANVPLLLESVLRTEAFVFDVQDDALPQNAGIWDGTGKGTRRAPQLRLTAGRLGQFLCGYRTMQDIVSTGEAEALDAAAAQALDAAFPQQCCFITDEY